MENPDIPFKREMHKAFLLSCLSTVPSLYVNMDTTRVVITFFALSGLDVLNELDSISKERKQAIIDWVYSLQVVNDTELTSGFQGSNTFNTQQNRGLNAPYKWGHIASTYSALSILLILGDDFSRVNRSAIIKSLRKLQLEDGSFKGAIEGAENDMRFVFCASCICYILDDWTGMDVEKMVQFVLNSISYDGGIGQGPLLESHSGSTFCAIASLALSEQLHRIPPGNVKNLKRWLISRLDFGFSGRPNKPADTCYSFWTGGALKILHAYHFIEAEVNKQYVLMTQDRHGGFAKVPNTMADPMHTYFGLAGLSIMKVKGLTPMFCALNLTQRSHLHLTEIHEKLRQKRQLLQ